MRKYDYGQTDLKDHYIKIRERTVHVVMQIDFSNTELMEYLIKNHVFVNRKGYADVHSAMVWIYEEEKPKLNPNQYPVFWIEDDQIKKTYPDDEVEKEANITNVRKMSLQEILHGVGPGIGAELNRKIKTIINQSSAMVLPVFRKKDDFLKLHVKSIFRKKKLSLTNIPGGAQPHLAANMRSALIGETKTSPKYFVNWEDLLNFDYFGVAISNGGDEYPFEEAIIYSSYDNMISYIPKEKVPELVKLLKSGTKDPYLVELANRNDDDVPDEQVEVLDPGTDEDEEGFTD